MSQKKANIERAELERLLDLGYTTTRIADKFDTSKEWVRRQCIPYPDLMAKLVANGKVRHPHQRPLPAGNPR